MKTYQLVGVTDEVTDCGCCNRTNLKKTVVLQYFDDAGNPDEFHFFGSACARKALKWGDTKKAGKTVEVAARLGTSDAVAVAINKIRDKNLSLFGGSYYLPETVQAWIDRGGEVTNDDKAQALKLVRDRHPLIGYAHGVIELQEAFKILLVS